MVFLKEFFEKDDFEKISRQQQKHAKFPDKQRVQMNYMPFHSSLYHKLNLIPHVPIMIVAVFGVLFSSNNICQRWERVIFSNT